MGFFLWERGRAWELSWWGRGAAENGGGARVCGGGTFLGEWREGVVRKWVSDVESEAVGWLINWLVLILQQNFRETWTESRRNVVAATRLY